MRPLPGEVRPCSQVLTTIFGNVACTRAAMYSTRGSARDTPSSSPIFRPLSRWRQHPHRAHAGVIRSFSNHKAAATPDSLKKAVSKPKSLRPPGEFPTVPCEFPQQEFRSTTSQQFDFGQNAICSCFCTYLNTTATALRWVSPRYVHSLFDLVALADGIILCQQNPNKISVSLKIISYLSHVPSSHT